MEFLKYKRTPVAVQTEVVEAARLARLGKSSGASRK
jgi:hypothetical protein